MTPEGTSGFITQDETDPQRALLEPDMPGVWIVGLTVSDGTLDSRATTLALMVDDEANQPPVANCGSDQLVSPGGLVALDGAAGGQGTSYTRGLWFQRNQMLIGVTPFVAIEIELLYYHFAGPSTWRGEPECTTDLVQPRFCELSKRIADGK